jgi:ubiquitin-protein ligase
MAMVLGQEGTPYYGGAFFFHFEFPETYPYAPPKVTFSPAVPLGTPPAFRFHPNLYADGKVCLSILNTWEGEQWTACQTIRSVLLHLFLLLSSPTPLTMEPGLSHELFLQESDTYNECIRFFTLFGIRLTLQEIQTQTQQDQDEDEAVWKKDFLAIHMHQRPALNTSIRSLQQAYPVIKKQEIRLYSLLFEIDTSHLCLPPSS